MNRKSYFLLTALLLTCPFNSSVGQESWSTVSGHVFSAQGRPIAHAIIEVFPLEAAISGPLPIAVSNDDGAYHLRSPGLGKTRICARLENLGYPDTRAKVFASGDETFPEVVLAAGSILSNVDIHLGPPDGSVEGAIMDKQTQEAVPFARITLRWADQPSVMYSSSVSRNGLFQYPLPQRPITLSITAPGYRPWTYVSPYTQQAFIDLHSGERRTIKVELIKVSAIGP